MKSKSMNKIIERIKLCDVILKNGQKNFVGLYYYAPTYDAPEVLLKCDFGLNYCLSKIVDLIGTPCIERKILAQSLFKRGKEGYYIPREFFAPVATIYSKLPDYCKKKEDENEKFLRKLNNDVLNQLYYLEKRSYKKVEKKFRSKKRSRLKTLRMKPS